MSGNSNPPAGKSGHPSKNRQAAMEQDTAAGGSELRKLRTKSGDVATVSLSLSPSEGGLRVTLRFKVGGSTVQRPVGTVKTASRAEALKLGWGMLREKRLAENEGWSWVVPSSKHEAGGLGAAPDRSSRS